MTTRITGITVKAAMVAGLALLVAGGLGGAVSPREAAALTIAPDLVVRSINVDGRSTTVTIANNGVVASGGFMVSLTGRGGRSYLAWVPGVALWSSVVVTFQEVETGCGDRTVAVDVTRLVTESNETNNRAWFPYPCG